MNSKHIIITTLIVLLMCGMASATTHTVCASGCGYTTIQAAVTAASSYDTVYVYNGTYTENVDISTANLTIEGEGADVVTVTAASSADHAFYVTTSHVNISGFNVTNATDLGKAGIHLGYGANYCNISNNILTSNEYGIRLNSISGGNLTGNNASWNTYGIYLEVVEDVNLTSNIARSNIYGIYAKSGYYTNLTSNIARSNIYGIYLESSSNGNTLTDNTVNTSIYGIYFDSSTNNAITSNNILNILKTYSYLQTSSQEGTVGTKIDFNFTMKNVTNADCSSCTYNLELSQSEASFQHSKTGAIVTGNFTPARTGIYSLTLNITDPNNNIEKRKYIYLINSTANTVDYYFRDVIATHGQPTSYGTDHDAGSLLFELPSSEEDVWCGGYVGFSVDVLPDNLFGVFKNINYSIWYKTGGSGYTGIQRHGNTTTSVDTSQSISSTPKIFGTFSFMDVNWTNDYFWEWYRLSIKLTGSTPHIYSNQTHPSYANITYNYSTTPAIKSISNEDILLLSATSPASDNTDASIVLDGTGSTYLVVQMPNTALTYTATWDGGSCTGGDCSFTQSSGEMNFTLTLGSEHTINISEAAAGNNYIDISANKYALMRKDVTAAQTFSTIAGGFSHDICYSWFNNSGECWESYWDGDSYHSTLSIPEHDAYFVLMDGTGENISCSIAAAESVSIPVGWYITYLRESTAKTLTQIKTDMQVDGTVTNLYTWDHNAGGTGAWVSVDVTPSHSVLPNQGILINNMGAPYNWDGAVS